MLKKKSFFHQPGELSIPPSIFEETLALDFETVSLSLIPATPILTFEFMLNSLQIATFKLKFSTDY